MESRRRDSLIIHPYHQEEPLKILLNEPALRARGRLRSESTVDSSNSILSNKRHRSRKLLQHQQLLIEIEKKY